MIKKYIVHDLGDYLNTIADISGSKNTKQVSPPILWFRAQPSLDYTLIPSILRENSRGKTKIKDFNYSRLHFAEDIRMQHYIAKNFHMLSLEPSSRVEWLEVMQHHLIKTRIMDWSESSIHSLIFAIEPFLFKNTSKSNQNLIPCVWVLNPQKINRKIVQYLSETPDLVRKIISDLSFSNSEADYFLSLVCKTTSGKDLYKSYLETDDTQHINYIFNLSSINDDLTRERIRLKNLLLTGTLINPYFYLLSRIYSDGILLDNRDLPPLSVIHPYHCERIKSQKGVFSVFPFYREHRSDNAIRKKLGYNPDGMNYNHMAQNCLCQIIIQDPQKTAYQMMKNGMYDSWLYPEMPVV